MLLPLLLVQARALAVVYPGTLEKLGEVKLKHPFTAKNLSKNQF